MLWLDLLNLNLF